MFDLNNIEALQIELTNQCNAACPACSRSIDAFNFNSKKDKAEISLEQFKEYFDKPFLRKLKKISFAGNFGDPIMAKDIFDIVKYIKQSNPLLSISINTNGSLRSSEWWAELGKLMQYSKDIVVWSIDGLEDTNLIYRVNTNWNKIFDNVRSFISAGGNAHWAMLVFDYNEHQVNDCQKLAQGLGFKEFISKYSTKHTIEVYNKAFPRQPSNYNYRSGQGTQISCTALLDKSIYISAHGTILPCCFLGDRIYLDKFSNSHPNILPKDHLNLKNLPNAIKLFNEIAETWGTSNPVDVCKDLCSKNKEVITDYSFNEKEIVSHVKF